MMTTECELPQIDIITSVKQLITRLCKDNDDWANVLGDTLPADYVIQTASPNLLPAFQKLIALVHSYHMRSSNDKLHLEVSLLLQLIKSQFIFYNPSFQNHDL